MTRNVLCLVLEVTKDHFVQENQIGIQPTYGVHNLYKPVLLAGVGPEMNVEGGNPQTLGWPMLEQLYQRFGDSTFGTGYTLFPLTHQSFFARRLLGVGIEVVPLGFTIEAGQ